MIFVSRKKKTKNFNIKDWSTQTKISKGLTLFPQSILRIRIIPTIEIEGRITIIPTIEIEGRIRMISSKEKVRLKYK